MALAKNSVLFESICYLFVDIVRYVQYMVNKKLISSNDRLESIRKY
jgi:hypothetical protein